jgi:hypothetical protein
MAHIVQLEKPALKRADPDGFILTETAEDILRSIALVRSIKGSAITMVSGAPGIGKTEALLHFERQNLDSAVYVAVAKGEGTPFHIGTLISNQFHGRPTTGLSLPVLRQRVGDCLRNNPVLLVDEAQNMLQRGRGSASKGDAFGWLIAVAEQVGFDIVFCGDLQLQAVLFDFPHYHSRMRRPVVIHKAPMADVAAMAAQDGIIGAAEIGYLARIAELPGGLRNVENSIRMAAIFADKGQIGLAHLKAAVSDLKLRPKGGK